MEKWHGSQDSPRVPLPWWNPTSGRVLQREPAPSAPGLFVVALAKSEGRAPPRYSSSGLCRGRLSSFPRSSSLHGPGSGCLRQGSRTYSLAFLMRGGFLQAIHRQPNMTLNIRLPFGSLRKMVHVRFFTGVDFHLHINVQPSTTLNMRLAVA